MIGADNEVTGHASVLGPEYEAVGNYHVFESLWNYVCTKVCGAMNRASELLVLTVDSAAYRCITIPTAGTISYQPLHSSAVLPNPQKSWPRLQDPLFFGRVAQSSGLVQ